MKIQIARMFPQWQDGWTDMRNVPVVLIKHSIARDIANMTERGEELHVSITTSYTNHQVYTF